MKNKCNTLIWLGAGTATNPNISFETFKRVIFVDALPNLVVQPNSNNIEVYNIGLNTREPVVDLFNIYNVQELSSFNRPTDIYELYPNLSKVAEIQVECKSVDEFLNDLNLPGNSCIKIIIDIPDFPLSFLKNIVNCETFKMVTKLVLFTTHQPMFENAATISDTINFLEEQLGIRYDLDESDPDFILCDIDILQTQIEKYRLTELEGETLMLKSSLQESISAANILEEQLAETSEKLIEVESKLEKEELRSAQQREALSVSASTEQTLKKQFKDATDHIKAAELKLDKKEQQLEKSEEKLNEANSTEQALEAKLKTAESKLGEKEQHIQRLDEILKVSNSAEQALEAKLKAAELILDEKEQKIEKLNITLNVATSAEEGLNNKLISIADQLKEVESTLGEKEQHIQRQEKEFENSLANVKNTLDSYTRKLNEANERIDNLLSSQSMNLRLLQKSEADNIDLRDNVVNKNKQIENMTCLLTDLHEKLRLASNFYDQLIVQHPELLEMTRA